MTTYLSEMPPSNLTMILRLLPLLTDNERRTLKLRLDALYQGDASAAQVESEEQLIYAAVCKALETVTHKTYKPLPTLKGDERKEFDTTAVFIHKWIDRWVPGLSRSERNSVYLLLAELAMSKVRHWKTKEGQPVPLSTSLLIKQLQGPGELVDAAYPGYLRNGTFPLVIRQRLKGGGGDNVRTEPD